jgi:hypothetical protein
MRTLLSITDFRFILSGYGHYVVIYTDSKGKEYSKTIDNMSLVDATKNADYPKQSDMRELRRQVTAEW